MAGGDNLYGRLENCHNWNQGDYKKVLCVCSAGLLRSASATVVLQGEPFNFNCRSAGMNEDYALVVVDEVLLEWADEIVCMERVHEVMLKKMTTKPIKCLDITDSFEYRNPVLLKTIREKYEAFDEKAKKKKAI